MCPCRHSLRTNADVLVPSALGLMVADDELQGFFLTEGIFDAVDFVRIVENCQPPAPKASENRPVRRDQNRLWDGLVLRSGGLVELVYYTGPANFRQRGMQPQLIAGPDHGTPLSPAHHCRVESWVRRGPYCVRVIGDTVVC